MSADFRGNAMAEAGDQAPGEHLRAEIARLGLDQVAVSQATGVSRQSINNIVNGRQPISRAMAGKLGRLTGHSSDYWLRAMFPRAGAVRTAHKRKPAEPATRPLGVGVLVNHQISRAVHDGVIDIDPFDETRVQMASVELTLDDFVLTADGEKIDISDGGSFLLRGGRTVNVSTREWIELPQDYIGRIGAIAALARAGIVTAHGFQIEPGFKGNLHFCIFNAGNNDFALRGGDPIISVEIMPLSATPRYDAVRDLAGASDRDKIAPAFRNDICGRLIRAAVRARAEVEIGHDGAKAKIADLSIEVVDASADAALDDAVHSALNALKTLREKPNAARADRDRYHRFFGDIAERLYLTSDEARRGVAALGPPIEMNDTLVATLRDGSEAVVPLPLRSAKVSLRHLARQLREDPLDLLLILGGAQPTQTTK